MKIGVVYNRPAAEGQANWEASQDVLQQVEAVEQALTALEIPSICLPFDRDLGRFARTLRQEKITGIFNLCETVDEDPRLIGHPAAVFDLLGLSYTGSGPLALLLSTDKLLSKRQLAAAGLPTPDYFAYDGGAPAGFQDLPLPAIIKPRNEDASIGIDQESIIHTAGELKEKLPEFHARYGSLVVEQFIAGREFNVSLLGYPDARLLPAAEIDFSAFPKELHRIVGYRAKWDADAFEYHHTNRMFPDDLPGQLKNRLGEVAAQTYQLFMLRDYGRIDLRVDERDTVYVLEANANPCLSPDAGLAAAAGQAGINYQNLINELVSILAMRSVS